MIRNTVESYGSVSKLFHWTIALLVLGLLAVGLYMTDLSPEDSFKWALYGYHEEIGVLVLGLVVLRILWRWGNELPALPDDMRPILKKAAHFVHYSLYVLLIVTPISGVLLTIYNGNGVDLFGVYSIPAMADKQTDFGQLALRIHTSLLYFWLSFISIHFLAGMYHFLVRRDKTLQKMLPWGS